MEKGKLEQFLNSSIFFSVKKPVWKHNICALCSCPFYREEEHLGAWRVISVCALCFQWGNEPRAAAEV